MMSWSMPHRTLQVVAFLLILTTAVGFAMGLAGALQRGAHMPGRSMLSSVTGAAPIDAEDATPLSNDRIEGAAKVDEESKAANQTEEEAVEAPVAKPLAGNSALAAVAPPPLEVPAPGNTTEQSPPPDEPPH